jgi:hypothetical protein
MRVDLSPANVVPVTASRVATVSGISEGDTIMTKVKHRDRKQHKTPPAAKSGGDFAKSPSLEAQQGEHMLMPVSSAPVAHKKEKRFGHN